MRELRVVGLDVDAMLADLGNPFRFELGELQKRRLASVLVDMYRQKGADYDRWLRGMRRYQTSLR